MTDKVQKIREEVERIQFYTQSEVLKQILDFIDSLQEEPAPKIFEDMLNAKTPAESLGISQEEHNRIVDELIYGKEPELVDVDDLPNKEEEPVSEEFEKKFISFVNATHDNNGSYSLHDFAQRLYNIAKEELKEPVSEDLEEAMRHNAPDNIGIDDLLYWRNGFITGAKWQKTKEEPVSVKNKLKALSDSKQHLGWIDDAMALEMGEDLVKEVEGYIDTNGFDGLDSVEAVKSIACHFVNWQKTKDESTTEDLGEYVNELSKQFPEVSFAKLSRIAVRVAKWQKQQEYTCYEEAFEDGAAWKYEQMMKGSIDAKIGSFTNGTIYDADFNIDSNLKDNDKVKVIVIKKD